MNKSFKLLPDKQDVYDKTRCFIINYLFYKYSEI